MTPTAKVNMAGLGEEAPGYHAEEMSESGGE